MQTREDLDLIMSSGLFDEDWYLTNNPDIAKAKVDPLLHFLQTGGFERSLPRPNFSSAWYLDTHADIKNAGINPLIHYLRNGSEAGNQGHAYLEGRKWVSMIDLAAQIVLQSCLDRLEIPLKSNEVLTHLKTALRGDKYSIMLQNIFTFEQFISAQRDNNTIYPLVQASKLPEITDKYAEDASSLSLQCFPILIMGAETVFIPIKILSQNNEIYLSTCFNPDEDAYELKKLEPYCHSIQTIPYWQFGGNQTEIRTWLRGIQMDIVHYEWPCSLENYDPSFGQIQIFTYMEALSLRLLMDMKRVEPIRLPGWQYLLN